MPGIIQLNLRNSKYSWPLRTLGGVRLESIDEQFHPTIQEINQKIYCRKYGSFKEIMEEMFDMLGELKDNIYRSQSKEVCKRRTVRSLGKSF